MARVMRENGEQRIKPASAMERVDTEDRGWRSAATHGRCSRRDGWMDGWIEQKADQKKRIKRRGK